MKRAPETITLTDRQLQARLERMLAARQAGETNRKARYEATRSPRSQFRAGVKAPMTDVRMAPSPLRAPARFTWRDLITLLLPAALFGAAVLFAHWAGWLA